jgi:RNA polymerase sigma factor for flagellar operon FliA
MIAQTQTQFEVPARAPAPVDMAQLWHCYARSGHGSSAENELVERHLPLVRTVVGRVAMSLPPHVDMEDLHSAGLVGLLNAIRRFNPRSGASFETYARVRIRGSVLDELRRLDWVPRSVHEKARKVQEVMLRLEQVKGGIPSEEDMAEAMDLSLDEYRELLAEVRPATFICLDSVRTAEGEDGSRHGDVLADDSDHHSPCEQTERRELARLIAERLEDLPDVQRKVLALYYFEDLRLREIAEVFGVTESRICQIHAQAILALKSFLRRRDPEVFACR